VDRVDNYLFDGEYLLIAEDGENLRTRNTPIAFLVNGKFWVNNHAHIVRGNHKADTRYLMYALSNLDISGYLTGSTMPKLTQGNMNRISLSVPPLSEQRAIAHILGTLDDKIELNRRMNQTLEAMARAIFKDWFVDFGPVRAKMEEREPYLPPEIWGLFPDALDEEGKPKGWTFDTLARLAITNCESWTARHHPPVVEYVDLSNTKWGNINATTFLDWETAPSRARRIAKAGDTIVGTTRPGNGSFAYISRDGLTVSTGFAVLSPNTAKYRDAVYLATTSTENIKRLADLADGHGGAYPAVKPNEVTDTVIVFPGDEVLASFSDLVSPTRKKIEHARVESGTLGQIRDFLVPKLISGEFRVSDAERIVERAT
jgi:type I restriction enzyme S subunit